MPLAPEHEREGERDANPACALDDAAGNFQEAQADGGELGVNSGSRRAGRYARVANLCEAAAFFRSRGGAPLGHAPAPMKHPRRRGSLWARQLI